MISYAYHIYVYSCFWYCHSSLTFRNFTVIWPSNPHAKSLQCFLHYFSCLYSLFSSTIPVVLTCIRTILCTPSFHNAYYKFLWVVICGSGPSWLVLEVMRAQHTVPQETGRRLSKPISCLDLMADRWPRNWRMSSLDLIAFQLES